MIGTGSCTSLCKPIAFYYSNVDKSLIKSTNVSNSYVHESLAKSTKLERPFKAWSKLQWQILVCSQIPYHPHW